MMADVAQIFSLSDFSLLVRRTGLLMKSTYRFGTDRKHGSLRRNIYFHFFCLLFVQKSVNA